MEFQVMLIFPVTGALCLGALAILVRELLWYLLSIVRAISNMREISNMSYSFRAEMTRLNLGIEFLTGTHTTELTF